MGPVWLGPEKNFQYEGTQKAGKCYFKVGSCICRKCFLLLYVLSTVVQELCILKPLQELPDLDDLLTNFT